jgi:anti-sigma-K factor RskA
MFTCGDPRAAEVVMSELTCDKARESAAEFALGILLEPDRALLAAHLSRCEDCRSEIDSFTEIAALLVSVVPGSEPPLGFDRRVLTRVRFRRGRVVVTVAALASMAAAVLGGLAINGYRQPKSTGLVVALRQGSSVVGTLTASGHPTWVSMTIRGAAVSGQVTCQLLERNGTATTLGTFDLVNGSGTWAAPDPSGVAHDLGARLIDAKGRVMASATFH